MKKLCMTAVLLSIMMAGSAEAFQGYVKGGYETNSTEYPDMLSLTSSFYYIEGACWFSPVIQLDGLVLQPVAGVRFNINSILTGKIVLEAGLFYNRNLMLGVEYVNQFLVLEGTSKSFNAFIKYAWGY